MRSDRYKEEPKKKTNHLLAVLFVFIILLLTALALAVLRFYMNTLDSISLEFSDDSPVLEVGEEHRAMDYVESCEGEVTPSAEYLDTGSAGVNALTYTVTKPIIGGLLSPSKKYNLKYEVSDTTPPLIMNRGDGALIERGTEFDINNIISFGDNADPSPSVTVDGNVDTSVNGDYPLHIKVEDASGNAEEWDASVTVTDSIPPYEEPGGSFAFADFVSEYKGSGKTFGIDVSEWQKDIDFEAVKKAGCEFVIIRVGYGDAEKRTEDEKFRQNFSRAKEAGLKVGVYFYSYDNTEESVRDSAKWIIEKLGGEKLELPVAFDWEEFAGFQTYKMSFYTLNRLYDAFADELSNAGYETMLYGSKIYLEKVWSDTDTRPVWLAHYTEKTDYESPYVIWQAGSTGRIDGIDGAVDLDIMYE